MPSMIDVDREHPAFQGDREHLRAFMRLAASPIRHAARQDAITAWDAYKLECQLADAGRQPRGRSRQPLNKRGYVRALTARAIDLRGANLDGVCLGYVDLRGVRFDGATLRGAWLKGARLDNASLVGCDLSSTDAGRGQTRLLLAELRGADLSGARLAGADLSQTTLDHANFTGADLTGACLEGSTLIRAKLAGARLDGARIYGTAAWDLEGEPATQRGLVITPGHDAPVTVDELAAAQFLYLMLRNPAIRGVISTVTTRTALILGRFTPERKRMLEVVRVALRLKGLVPVMFDFPPARERDLIETVRVLAGMARLVIADLSDPAAVREELHTFVPDLPSVMVQPIIESGAPPYSMFDHWRRYPWVRPLVEYRDEHDLTAKVSQVVDLAPSG